MPLRIMVTGMAAATPHHGGATWIMLQYVLGLRELGHDVCFVEPVEMPTEQGAASPAETEAGRYFAASMAWFGVASRTCMLAQSTKQTVGMSYGALRDFAGSADVIINVAGMLTDPAILERAPIRAYLDLDPGFLQIWQAQGIDMRLGGHTHYLTVAPGLGESGKVPLCGVDWLATWPPVVLSQWPVCADAPRYGFTTISNFRGYGSVTHEGVFYGQKVHSLRQLLDLPMRTDERFELAMGIHPAESKDLAALAQNRWHLLDPVETSGSPAAYRDFVAGSKAEFGLAKAGYVTADGGWFSDRSVCYLASGRPVLAQETGFSRYLPTGKGLLSFRTSDEAAEGAARIAADYAAHCRAARALAEERFSSHVVLPRLLTLIGAA